MCSGEWLKAKQEGAEIICATCGKRCADNIPPDYRTTLECQCAVLIEEKDAVQKEN